MIVHIPGATPSAWSDGLERDAPGEDRAFTFPARQRLPSFGFLGITFPSLSDPPYPLKRDPQ